MAERISYLPKEVVMEILSWVPADSVVNFKLVSKPWLALITELINDPSFVATHLINTKKRPSASLIVGRGCSNSDQCQRDRDCREVRLSSITFLENEHKNDKITFATNELDLPPPGFAVAGLYHRFHAFHCDGIVCLAQDPNTIFICNPILHEYRIVQKLESGYFESMGFVYNSRTNDYMLIRVCVKNYVRAEVYSLRNDSWKVIKMPDNMDMQDFLCESAFCWRGVCYWYVIDMEDDGAILCFDICSEEFQVMYIPDADDISEYADFILWDGSVAWYRCNEVDRPGKDDLYFLEIYVLDDGNSEKNKAAYWKKQLMLGPFPYPMKILAFINNKVLIRDTNGDRLTTHNVHTKLYRKVRSLRKNYTWQDSNCSYERSLVSVKRR